MNEQELRLECLKLAMRGEPRATKWTISVAKKYAGFVLDEKPLPEKSDEDTIALKALLSALPLDKDASDEILHRANQFHRALTGRDDSPFQRVVK